MKLHDSASRSAEEMDCFCHDGACEGRSAGLVNADVVQNVFGKDEDNSQLWDPQLPHSLLYLSVSFLQVLIALRFAFQPHHAGEVSLDADCYIALHGEAFCCFAQNFQH